MKGSAFLSLILAALLTAGLQWGKERSKDSRCRAC